MRNGLDHKVGLHLLRSTAAAVLGVNPTTAAGSRVGQRQLQQPLFERRQHRQLYDVFAGDAVDQLGDDSSPVRVNFVLFCANLLGENVVEGQPHLDLDFGQRCHVLTLSPSRTFEYLRENFTDIIFFASSQYLVVKDWSHPTKHRIEFQSKLEQGSSK